MGIITSDVGQTGCASIVLRLLLLLLRLVLFPALALFCCFVFVVFGLVVTVVVVVVPSLPSATDSPNWQHTNCMGTCSDALHRCRDP